jgi:hypothetical protein
MMAGDWLKIEIRLPDTAESRQLLEVIESYPKGVRIDWSSVAYSAGATIVLPKRRRKQRAADTPHICPPALRSIIDWWNGLRAEGLVPHAVGVDSNEAVCRAWERVQQSTLLHQSLADLPRLAAEIRQAPICREGWFRLEKLLGGRNPDREYVIIKLLQGGYRARGKHREREQQLERYNAPDAGQW